MLTGKRTSIADDKIGSAFHEFAVIANAGFTLQIETDPHMNAAVPEMPVKGGVIVVRVEKLSNVTKIGAHFFRSYRGIIPAFPFGRRAGRRRRRTRAGLAYLPNPLGLAIAVEPDVRKSGGLPESVGKREGERLSFIGIIASKFHQQDSSSL